MHAGSHDSELPQGLNKAIDTLTGPSPWQWLLGKHNVARIDINNYKTKNTIVRLWVF